jgi:hypothetical protein
MRADLKVGAANLDERTGNVYENKGLVQIVPTGEWRGADL